MKLKSLLCAWLSLGACTIVTGGRIETCGEYPAGGGPAVISFQDEQLCDVVRLRVLRQLDGRTELTQPEIDRLLDRTLSWQRRSTVAELVAAIRTDAGDAMADDVQRAIDSVVAQAGRPVRADCPDAEKCLVRGAAKGARIALLYAQPTARPPKDDTGTPPKN